VTAFDLPFEIDLDKLTGLPPDQLEEAMAHIQALKRGLQANPMWTIMPHLGEHGRKLAEGLPLTGRESRGQVEFLECTPRGVFHAAVVAGNRFGKTQINVIEARDPDPPARVHPAVAAAVQDARPAVRDIRDAVHRPRQGPVDRPRRCPENAAAAATRRAIGRQLRQGMEGP
jgi:hypothetical protein